MTNLDKHWVEVVAARINGSIVKHHTYTITKSRLFSKTLVQQVTDCRCLAGPSRIGKTSVVKDFESELNPKFADELLSWRPVVRLTCRNRGDRGGFTTKGFFLDALSDIEHPFYKLDGKDIERNHELIRRHDRETTTTLQAVFENALIILRTKYLIIDETQHLRYMNGGENSTLKMLEFFKTLAEKLELTLIFVGAYPILNVLELSPHMLGRIAMIEMKRYTEDSEESLVRFHELLNWYSKDMHFTKGVNSLCDWNRELFDGSLGVIGLLSSWVRDAMSEMMARGDHSLSLDHLRYTRKSQFFLNEMAREIIDGENYLQGKGGSIGSPNTKTKTKTKKRRGSKRPFDSNQKRRKKGERS